MRVILLAALLCALSLAAADEPIDAERLTVVYHVHSGECEIMIKTNDKNECFATVTNLSKAKKIIDLLQKGKIEQARETAKDD